MARYIGSCLAGVFLFAVISGYMPQISMESEARADILWTERCCNLVNCDFACQKIDGLNLWNEVTGSDRIWRCVSAEGTCDEDATCWEDTTPLVECGTLKTYSAEGCDEADEVGSQANESGVCDVNHGLTDVCKWNA